MSDAAPAGLAADGGNPAPDVPAGNPQQGGDVFSSLSEENRSVVQAKGWQGVDEVVASYRNLEKLVGRKEEGVLRRPGADAAPEEVSAFWQELGKPESPAEYGFAAPEGVGGYDKALGEWFGELAHANNLPKDTAVAIHDAMVQRIAELNAEQTGQRDQQIEQWNINLQRELGDAFEERTGRALRALSSLAGDDADELLGVLEESGLGSHPALVKAMIKAADLMSEDTMAGQAPRTLGSARSPGEIQSEIDGLQGRNRPYDEQRKLPYWDDTHPDHKAVVSKVEKLFGQLEGGDVSVTEGSIFRVG